MGKNEIGERLREERKRLGMNQSEFGTEGGVQKASQLNYEKGNRSPDAAYLHLIAMLGVDVMYVITGVRSATPQAGADRTGEVVMSVETDGLRITIERIRADSALPVEAPQVDDCMTAFMPSIRDATITCPETKEKIRALMARSRGQSFEVFKEELAAIHAEHRRNNATRQEDQS